MICSILFSPRAALPPQVVVPAWSHAPPPATPHPPGRRRPLAPPCLRRPAPPCTACTSLPHLMQTACPSSKAVLASVTVSPRPPHGAPPCAPHEHSFAPPSATHERRSHPHGREAARCLVARPRTCPVTRFASCWTESCVVCLNRRSLGRIVRWWKPVVSGHSAATSSLRHVRGVPTHLMLSP